MYQTEAEYITLNSTIMEAMLLTTEEARKCEADALRTCTSVSPIYVADKKGIKENCQV